MIGQLASTGMISTIDNFVFGVVTSGGTYLLGITDLNALLAYYAANQDNLAIIEVVYKNYVDSGYSYFQNELGLLTFLQTVNMGLTLYKGDVNGFNSWNRIGTNRNRTQIINLNCK
ncbi:hypothetical protein A3SI_07374 [Nitritalea halalkaliphila LW7]|uniref:Uncharacterized protein n=1 Tax=Nitritalea halalkaliphila LW7 TaxID=1189621 RepID=I5C5K2_9BACT|nr:hypothetical protein [Nitritalea halalkaliphila]EIM77104.1 hypothetical protein A3SI_07374 [Nitritalea halalkaliphila LW7]